MLVALISSFAIAGEKNYSHGWKASTPSLKLEKQFFSASEMYGVPDIENSYGAATLVRSRNAIRASVSTLVASAGIPYTVWIVVFNRPDQCDGACSEPDLLNPKVKGAVYFGAGAISVADGNGGGVLNVSFESIASRIPKGTFRLDDPLEPDSLFFDRGIKRNNGLHAEIHLVVDEHPLPNNGWVGDLTTTNLPGAGPALNHRFAVFKPVR